MTPYRLMLSAMLSALLASAVIAAPDESANEKHEALKNQADELYRNGEYEQAEQLLTQVLNENPKDDVALYLRSSARVELGAEVGDAALIRSGVSDSRAALAVQFNVDYYLPYLYGMSRLAEVERKPEHASSGLAVVDKVLQMPEASADQKANLYFQRNLLHQALGDKTAAQQDLQSAIALQPRHVASHTALCNLVLQSGDPQAAEAQFDRAITALKDEPIVFNNRGTFLQSRGRYDEAMKDFTQALTLDPTYVPALTNRGFVKIMQGQYGSAETDLTKSLELDPNQPVAFGLRAAARLYLNHADAAIQDYQTSVSLNPQNAAAHYDLGFAYFFHRDYASASRSFDEALRLDPSIVFLAPWRYTAMVFSNQRDQALSEFSAIERKPEQERTWFDLLTLYLMGKINEATLQAAINKDDPQARGMQECEANYFIGLRNASRNQADQAKQFFEKALTSSQRHLAAYRGAMYATGKFASR